MTLLSDFPKELEKWFDNIAKVSNNVVYSHVPVLLESLKGRSPVDTGKYKESWRVYRPHIGSSLLSYGFTNTDPKGSFLEFGVVPKSAPWYFPQAGKKRTGKLAVRNGLVWAGGLNPGHDKTVGGAIDGVFTTVKIQEIAIDVGQAVIEGL